MVVALSGMFRNSTRYLQRYFTQVHALQGALAQRNVDLRLIMVEGDSADATWRELHRYASDYDARIIKREHGGPAWGSEDTLARWQALAWVCDGILEAVEPDVHALLYVETDLAWEAGTMIELLDQLSPDRPVVSPMCFTAVGDFYDIWGHIKDGVNFSPFPPYHDALGPGLTKVDSAGSSFAMLGTVARSGIRYGHNDHMRGLGRSIYEHGYSWWVAPDLKVVHL